MRGFIGADDGASGAGVLLELARVLALHPELAAQVEFVFLDGEEAFAEHMTEEDGLYGSKPDAAQRAKEGTLPRYQVNLDMVGGADNVIAVPAYDTSDVMLSQYAKALMAENLPVSRWTAVPASYRDDHRPYLEQGVDSLNLIADFRGTRWWHKSGDTLDRIGTRTLKVDPHKIIGVVPTCENDHIPAFRGTAEVTDRIGENMVKFLEKEYCEGRIPKEFLPLQSGVGNVANAVLAHVGRSRIIPPFQMYTEVLQDTVVELMKEGRCTFASSACIHVSDEVLKEIYANFDFYREKILLRPQEISNNPAFARRIGLICMNTALEADLFGNINSTHLFGNMVMNGVGGSGDFARSAAYTIFSCPSTAKDGKISSIVPMVSHTDHTEHDIDIIVTEQGVADLRGKSPRERAELIIENCAHPDYRPLLRRYLELTPVGRSPVRVQATHKTVHAFAFHTAFQDTGDMRNADL